MGMNVSPVSVQTFKMHKGGKNCCVVHVQMWTASCHIARLYTGTPENEPAGVAAHKQAHESGCEGCQRQAGSYLTCHVTIGVRRRVETADWGRPPSWLGSLQPLANPDSETLPMPLRIKSVGWEESSGREVALTRGCRGERSSVVTWYSVSRHSTQGGLYKQARSPPLQDNDRFSISVYRWWEENMWRSPTPAARWHECSDRTERQDIALMHLTKWFPRRCHLIIVRRVTVHLATQFFTSCAL